MTKREKRLAALTRFADHGQGAVRWQDLVAVLEDMGFTADKSGGSHFTFINLESPGRDAISAVVKPHPQNEVKRYVAKKMVKFLRGKDYIGESS